MVLIFNGFFLYYLNALFVVLFLVLKLYKFSKAGTYLRKKPRVHCNISGFQFHWMWLTYHANTRVTLHVHCDQRHVTSPIVVYSRNTGIRLMNAFTQITRNFSKNVTEKF